MHDAGRCTSFPARRRLLLLALLATPFLALSAHAGFTLPQGLRRWGFLVYEATLWAGDDPQKPPLALQLTYRRSIEGRAIADASVKEMRKLGGADEATLQRWGVLMTKLFPDVRDGDVILGEYQPGTARFHFNGQLRGEIAEADFARQFFAIWLDPRTSAPELRAALLQRDDRQG
jgi:hypothetical protein